MEERSFKIPHENIVAWTRFWQLLRVVSHSLYKDVNVRIYRSGQSKVYVMEGLGEEDKVQEYTFDADVADLLVSFCTWGEICVRDLINGLVVELTA